MGLADGMAWEKENAIWLAPRSTVKEIGPGLVAIKDGSTGTSFGTREKNSTEYSRRPTMTDQVTNPKDKLGQKKPQMHLIPPVANVYEAKVMKTGADKYGPFNWRKDKIALSTYISALLRHLHAFQDGETYDVDSGQPHMAHVRANTGIILDAMEEGMAIDDRHDGHAGDVIAGVTREEVLLAKQAIADAKFADACEAFEVKIWNACQPTYYVAGPMRGRKHFNFPAFDTAAAAGSLLGYYILSPADMDRKAGLFRGHLPEDDEELTDEQMKGCIDRDVKAILGLDPRKDGIMVLPDWELSSGARAEVALARWLGLEVLCADDFETVLYPRKK